MHAALAGAAAAAAWGLLEPLDRRLFRCDYSDVALLARLSGGGRARGFAIHTVNGAVFGVASRRLRIHPLPLALAEHAALWPLLLLLEPEVARSRRAFAQGTFRHAVFGLLLYQLTTSRPSSTLASVPSAAHALLKRLRAHSASPRRASRV